MVSEPSPPLPIVSRKPKILRIINRFNLGGPTFNATYLTKYLENDFDTLFIGGEKMASEESSLFIPHNLGLQPRIIQGMSRSVGLSGDWKAYREIRRVIREFQPDLIHTHASKAGALGRMAGKAEGIKHLVHTFHGHVFDGYFNPLITRAVIASERYLARKTEKIIAISNLQKGDLAQRFKICPEDKIEVIKLGFDLQRFQENYEAKRKQFRNEWNLGDTVAIGIIGRLVPIKDHAYFLRIFSRQVGSGLNTKAIIVGDGELRSHLEKLVAELGMEIGRDVIFTSWRKDMDVVMAGLDIVALTSINEGTPVSLIEAQASGKAIISTDVGGVKDIVAPVFQEFVIDRSKDLSFIQKLSELITSEEKRNILGQAGMKYAVSEHSVEKLAQETKDLYQRIL